MHAYLFKRSVKRTSNASRAYRSCDADQEGRRGGRSRPSGMKPATSGAAEMSTASAPLKEGRETLGEGGATAPTQKAEQALQVE